MPDTTEEDGADEEPNLHQLNELHPQAPPGARRTWTRGERMVVVAGALLVLDLALAPWHHITLSADLAQFGIEVPSVAYDRKAIQDPQSFFGRAALVIAAAMVLQVVAAKLVTAVPRWEQVHLLAGPAVLGLLIAKLIANHEFLGLGAWAGLVLAAILAYGGFILSQETPGGYGRTFPWT
jgi:hypothetical protein